MAQTKDAAPPDPDARLKFVFIGITGAISLLVAIAAAEAGTASLAPTLLTLIGTLYLVTSLPALLSQRISRRLTVLQARAANWIDIPSPSMPMLLIGVALSAAGSFTAGAGSKPALEFSLPLWVLGIVLVGLALRPQGRETSSRLEARIDLGILLVLILAGGLIRVIGLERMPFALSGDEGSVGLVGWEFVEGSRTNPLGLGWFSFPALYSWLLSLSQVVFGRSVLSIRLVSAIAGTLTIASTYLAGRILFNRMTGLIAAAWLTFFHYHVFFSRIAYNNIFDGLFLILCIGLLLKGWSSNRRRDFLLFGLCLGFSQYFYTTSHAIPLILLLWLPWLHARHAAPGKRYPHLFAALLLAGCILMPLLAIYLIQPASLTFTAGRVSLLDPTLLGPAAEALGTTPLGLIGEQSLVTALGLNVSELQGVYLDSGVPMTYGLSSVVFVMGLAIALMRWRKPQSAILLLALLFSIVIGGLSIQAPSSQRLVLLPPILALFIASAYDTVRGWLDGRFLRLRPLFIGLLVISLGYMSYKNVRQLFLEYFPLESYGTLNGEVTQEMIDLLEGEPADVDIYFIGGERMQFDSIPSLAYLQPGFSAVSVSSIEDLALPLALPRRTLFLVLPEQRSALEPLAQAYPESFINARYNRHGRLLFYVRVVEPIA